MSMCALKRSESTWRRRAGQRARINRAGLALVEALGVRHDDGVIGGRRAHLLEEGPPRLESADERRVCRHRLASERPDPVDLGAPGRVSQRHGHVGPERGTDVAPALVADRLVVLERVARGVGRAEHLDVEALVQRAGEELRRRQARFQAIVDGHRGSAVQRLGDAEDPFELVLQPTTRGCSAIQVEMIGEQLPDLAWVGLDRCTVARRDAQALERDALRVEHARDVVIGDHQQRRGIGERLVAGEQFRLDVPVRAHQRQRLHASVEVDGDLSSRGFRVEVPVRMEHGRTA